MASPSEVEVRQLTDFTKTVDEFRGGTSAPVWFRGIGSVSHQLIPSLYRHPSKGDIKDLIELEAELLTRFRHRSIPYQNRPLSDTWELLFMMQHYGVPTRLLDWSENPFVAMYFAITSAEQEGFSEDAAIWMLDTQLWNSKVLSPYWKGRIVAIPETPLEGYAPGNDLMKLAELPVAMAGLHNSPRIVAQRGAFTIFGHKNIPMEKMFDDYGFHQKSLLKITIPKDQLSSIRESLFGIGYADSMIYPDLSGLSKEIKRHFGFGV